MNQAFSKIWIMIVVIIFIAGGILAWQYLEMPEMGVKDETTNWEIYENKNFGFEVKYPPSLKLVSTGPNSEQQMLERGETISGTVQPSYDTIIFSDKDSKEQFIIGIFHPYSKIISEKNYTEDYLYLYGSCDARWGFEPTSIEVKNINDIALLQVRGKQFGPHQETPTYLGCYYFKNSNENLVVLSTPDFNNQSNFKEVDAMLRNILLTLNLFELTLAEKEIKDEITNWKTYISTYFNFEIKYPSEWFLNENLQNISTVRAEEWLPLDTLPEGHAKVWFERTGVQTIDDLIIERFGPTTNNIITSDSVKTFNGLASREVIYTCKNCEARYISEIDEYLPGKEGKVVFFTKNNDVLYIWLYYHKNDPKANYYINIFNQILSTFRFLE